LTGAGELKRIFVRVKKTDIIIQKIFDSTTQNLQPPGRPRARNLCTPWCNVKIVTDILDMSTVSGYTKSQRVSGAGSVISLSLKTENVRTQRGGHVRKGSVDPPRRKSSLQNIAGFLARHKRQCPDLRAKLSPNTLKTFNLERQNVICFV
jgi:hypothetical protein